MKDRRGSCDKNRSAQLDAIGCEFTTLFTLLFRQERSRAVVRNFVLRLFETTWRECSERTVGQTKNWKEDKKP